MAGASVSWSSSDDEVASVSAVGLVTALKNGSAQITATSGDVSASVPVTVRQSARRVSIAPTSAMLGAIGDTVSFGAVVYDNGGNAMAGASVSWSSSDDEVASVSAVGLVTALKNGRAQITATSGAVSASVTVEVVIPSTDREILITLYHALDGPNWTHNTNWLSSATVDAWYGVTVGDDRRVVSLNLGNNNLNGPLPAELAQLSGLKGLALNGNDLTGPIPAQLGRPTLLTHLYLFDNRLTGPIPPELGRLTNLIHLCLDRNQLTGRVPPELGRLAHLKWLHLYDNFSLSGALPQALTSLNLDALLLQGTLLCIPQDPGFEAWLDGIADRRLGNCGEEADVSPDAIALIALYRATDGPNWKKNDGWLTVP